MYKTFPHISNFIDSGDEHSFLVWKEEDLFPILPYPARINFIAIFISVSGSMEGEINLQPARIDNTHIQVYTHSHAARIIRRSDDFKCVGLLFSKKYWEDTILQTHPFNAFTRLIPCIEVTQAQRERLLDFYRIIRSQTQDKGKEYNNEVIKHLIIGMFYELGSIYKDNSRKNKHNTSGERLMADFLELIYKNYRDHRDVAFYANELSLSQRYFTTAIKRTSGESALRWIEKYVILEAQIQLKNTDKSIKEIASYLNFEDTSFFCKYFKRITGITPESYRYKK